VGVKIRLFQVESHREDSDGCCINMLYSDEAWSVGDINNCPVCRNSPVQLLFDSGVSHKYTVGECMLCKQLIAYKRKIISHKRSKNMHSSYNLDSRKIEILKFLNIYSNCKKQCKNKNKNKKRDINNSNEQLKLLFER